MKQLFLIIPILILTVTTLKAQQVDSNFKAKIEDVVIKRTADDFTVRVDTGKVILITSVSKKYNISETFLYIIQTDKGNDLLRGQFTISGTNFSVDYQDDSYPFNYCKQYILNNSIIYK